MRITRLVVLAAGGVLAWRAGGDRLVRRALATGRDRVDPQALDRARATAGSVRDSARSAVGTVADRVPDLQGVAEHVPPGLRDAARKVGDAIPALDWRSDDASGEDSADGDEARGGGSDPDHAANGDGPSADADDEGRSDASDDDASSDFTDVASEAELVDAERDALTVVGDDGRRRRDQSPEAAEAARAIADRQVHLRREGEE